MRSATTITPSGKYHLGHVLSFRSPIPIFFARDWHFSNVPRTVRNVVSSSRRNRKNGSLAKARPASQA